MKNWICIGLLLTCFSLSAQTEGCISYEQIITMDIELPEDMQQYQALIPTEKKSKQELQFNAKESLYQEKQEVAEAQENPFGGNGVNVQIMTTDGTGGVGELYYGFEEGVIVKTVDMMGKKFLVEGPYQAADWKVLGEQKELLGYTCIKAERQTPNTTIIAWFTPQIPLPIGPNEWVGLPGAVLEAEAQAEQNSMKITATKVSLKPLEQAITKPNKGKKVSAEELEKIQEQRIEEMQKMYGGEQSENGNITIHRVERN